MNEIDNGPLPYKTLATGLVGYVLKMLALKWAVIFVVTKLLRRAAKKVGTP